MSVSSAPIGNTITSTPTPFEKPMEVTTIRPIHNEREHEDALRQIERLMDAEAQGDDADMLEALAVLVEDYERRHIPMRLPDPIAYIDFVMEARGITRKELEPYIG